MTPSWHIIIFPASTLGKETDINQALYDRVQAVK
jgi:hypothetical protein